MNKNYRWGILGAGVIAERFCTALEFVEGSEVYAIASRDADKAGKYAAKYNADVFYDNYADLLKDENVDIIYIATPHAFHHRQTMACLQYKKPVLCEKPMSLSYGQTKEMINAASESKVFLMEGMWTVCMPFIEKILLLINDDIIGDIKYISADFGFTAPVDLESRLYNKALGGGSMMDVGVYSLFLATLILGEPSLVKTISKLANTGIDEYTNIVLQYPNGETAHLLSAINFNTATEAQIIGTKGRIEIKTPWFKATDFSVHLNNGIIQNFAIPHLSNGFEYEIMEVMHCLDNGLLQSNKVPHNLSLSVSKIMDEVLHGAGVLYE
jgi:predicted dehydrogenase